MSMLSRYQKSGGFNQLLKLIEGFGPKKQEKFLTMIENENSLWAQALRDKMVSIKKLFSWDGIYIGEVLTRLPEITIAVVTANLSEEQRENAFSTLNFSQKKKILELIEEKSPSEGEINSACVRMVNEVRDMITQGILRVEKFDPALSVPDNIEDQLANGALIHSKNSSSTEAESSPEGSPSLDFSKAESLGKDKTSNQASLQNKLIKLNQENNQLKSEIKVLRDKLMQIRKIA